MSNYDYIKENYLFVKDRVDTLAKAAGNSVTLACVTKSDTDEELLALVRAGASDIAENRPQELARRGALLTDSGFFPRLHQIGGLQRNKVKTVLPFAHLIHSLDSLPLAETIERLAGAKEIRVPVLIEINSGEELQKGGIFPKDAERFYEDILSLPHLSVRGLMTMAPVLSEKEEYRKYFRNTKTLFDRLNARYGFDTDSPVLSMGMSDSYEVAMEEGSTLGRVGRRLFTKKENEHV